MLAANILWTLAYDTEYAMVDRDDDLRIGIPYRGDPVRPIRRGGGDAVSCSLHRPHGLGGRCREPRHPPTLPAWPWRQCCAHGNSV